MRRSEFIDLRPATRSMRTLHKPPAPTDIDLTTKFDLPFLSQSLRTLDIVGLLDTWEKKETFSGEKALRLSSSLSLSKRVLRFSAGDLDMKDLLSILDADGKTSVRSAGNGKSSSTDDTALSKLCFVDFGDEIALDDLLDDTEAMGALVAKVDDLSDDFRRVQQARAVPLSDGPLPLEADGAARGGAPAPADAPALVDDASLRAHFSAKFVSEVDIQVKKATKRRRANLLPDAIGTLTDFVASRALNPYATQKEKEALAEACDISTDQVSNWLTNYRKRRWRVVQPKADGDVAVAASAAAVEPPSGLDADELVLRASGAEIAAGL